MRLENLMLISYLPAKSLLSTPILAGKTDRNLLTVDSLRKHDNHMNSDDVESRSLSLTGDFDDESYRSSIGTTNTFNTFASDWSCCSNMTFNK